MNIFSIILVNPIINVLVAFYQTLVFLHIPSPLGFAIILLTVVIRLVLYPFISSQLKASKKMQDISPHLSRLRDQHKSDAKRLQEETMKLYKEHGVNPAAGCLPIIIQLPLIWALYSVLQQVVSKDQVAVIAKINAILYSPSLRLTSPWDQHFFGLPLGQHPSQLLATMPLILLVPILTGFLQFIQAKMMAPVSSPTLVVSEKNKKQKAPEKKEDDFAKAFQTQSVYILPLMIGYFSYNFPIGLSLYWNTFTLFGILQQYQLQGLGSLATMFNKKNESK